MGSTCFLPKKEEVRLNDNIYTNSKTRENKSSQPLVLSFRLRLPSNNGQHLTEYQKNVIRKTWKDATAVCKMSPGVKIFQNIFRRHPELKKLFHLEHVDNVDDLPQEENFVRHARIFASVIDLTVRNVDDLDVQIAPALITFGRRHYYKHQIGFRPEYTSIFAMAVMDFLLDHMNGSADKETIEAWWFISLYLITKLKQGYELESMHKGKQRLQWYHDKQIKQQAAKKL